MNSRHLAAAVFLVIAPLFATRAQHPAADTLRLGTLQTSATLRDPRGRELELLSIQSKLRQKSLDAESRPSLSVESMAQYQSDVPRIPIALPGGVSPPVPPHDMYDARVVAQQRLYDPAIAPRRAVEDAQLAESQAKLRVALFSVRQNVNDVFFASLRAQEQIAELQTTITDLEAQSRVAASRVREGAALPSEELALRAELLRRRQSVAEFVATRGASLEVLADLTGQSLDSVSVLGTPDLAADVARARIGLTDLRARAEYEQFAKSRAVLERQAQARSAQDKPRVSAYGRVGYGQPGLNPLNTGFDSYWLAGVQLQWTPWNWGTTSRDREVLAVQRQIVSVEEQNFTDNLRRGVAQDLASIDRLAGTLAADDEIVALRDRIAAETRVRFGEGVVTSAEYVDRETDVLSARISRATHRVELAQARVRLLTTLGIEVR
ncbi:MAG: TolC family protein [Gemmatimonadaceae bacterium]